MTLPVLLVALVAPAILYVLFYQGYAFWLARRAWRTRGPDPRPHARFSDADLPKVAVQLPIYNEGALVARVLAAATALDYPANRLVVQVLDDSDDEASLAAADAAVIAARRRCPEVTIQHLRRGDRSGFKAGNLRHGFLASDAAIFAVFDADFLPPADFLRQTIHHFSDPKVGLVQARWRYLNDAHPFARMQAEKLDLHQMCEQSARARSGLSVIFHGSAGLWRRAALQDAGAWHAQTEVEDLEASIAAAIKGWRFVYLDGLRVASELPQSLHDYVAQHMRWRRGGVRVAVSQSQVVARAPLPLGQRLDLLVRLHSAWSALAGLVMVLGALPFFWAMDQMGALIWGIAPYAAALCLSLATLVTEGRLLANDTARRERLHLRLWARIVPVAYLLLVVGMLVPLAIATLQGFGGARVWDVTPKSGARCAARVRLPGYVLAAIGFAMGALVLAAVSFVALHPMAVFFTLSFALGSVAVGIGGWIEARGGRLPWSRLLRPSPRDPARATAPATGREADIARAIPA